MEEASSIYGVIKELYCWGKAYVTEPKAVRFASRRIRERYPLLDKWEILLDAICEVSEKKYYKKANNF